MKKAFTLAEIMIVLTIIGILTVILLPSAFHSVPNENVMKFKKANATLYKVISELVSSGKYYKVGDLRYSPNDEFNYDAEGNDESKFNVMCKSMADILSTKEVNCVNNNGQVNVFAQSGAESTGCSNRNTICNLENAKLRLDEVCTEITDPKGFKTTDDVLWYEAHQNGNYYSTENKNSPNFPLCNPDCQGIDCNIIYKIFCIRIDSESFGYGIRSDGKILTGARADEWIKKPIQDDD